MAEYPVCFDIHSGEAPWNVTASKVLDQSIQLARNFEKCRKRWSNAEEELLENRSRLTKVEMELTALNVRFKHTCSQLDVQLRRRQKAEVACEQLERRLQLVHDILKSEASSPALPNEDQRSLLKALTGHPETEGQTSARLRAVDETLTSNSCISYDRTCDELSDTHLSTVKPIKLKNRDKRRSSRILVDRRPIVPRRSRSHSFDQIVDGVGSTPGRDSDTADSKTGSEREVHTGSPRELVRRRHADWNKRLPLLAGQIPGNRIAGSQQALLTAPGAPPGDPFTTPRQAAQTRPHIFVSKTIIMPEACVPCGRRIRFGRIALKCQSCSVVTHPDCKDRCPALCAPNFTVTSVKNGEGTVADFAPQTIPMIPSLVVHCINEIEQRGLQEPGIYRIPGGERTVRELKENYVRGKGLPLLGRVSNIHVVCGLLKDFLRKLKEPLVTFKLHSTFMALTDLPDNESSRGLSRAVHSLPRANRDTLAFLIIHLQRVMESPECRMDKQNIARVFGPTIVGHSNPNPNPLEVFEDTQRQPKVVEQLLSLSSDYWNQIVPVGQGTAQMGPSNTEPGLLIVALDPHPLSWALSQADIKDSELLHVWPVVSSEWTLKLQMGPAFHLDPCSHRSLQPHLGGLRACGWPPHFDGGWCQAYPNGF
ncbi:rac GTPase-activating protein 1-like [Carcharodon carcharias]|uniref:rac GTPase-activating protein 1-like n=1 Tax=Carcharodon carcharias TaxID=13397 RepID=UPI001B7F2416|nr:rac GTPase-activating protein 1-like [Carcharodon carcharias]